MYNHTTIQPFKLKNLDLGHPVEANRLIFHNRYCLLLLYGPDDRKVCFQILNRPIYQYYGVLKILWKCNPSKQSRFNKLSLPVFLSLTKFILGVSKRRIIKFLNMQHVHYRHLSITFKLEILLSLGTYG